ncbi:MAG: hypothetical protein B5M53_04875 [Candidatus Cloacimonas sp. 4484_209]|nr:MAG: hypothetical protein B5M53_04875 [Candidatus Cloacimonas sp. 4484_209]
MKKKELDFLFNISNEFIKIRDFDELIKKVLLTAKEGFGLANSALLLYDRDKKELFLKSYIGFRKKDVDGLRIPLGVGVTGKCAKRKMIVYVPDVSEESFYMKRFEPTKSELAIPLLSENELLGVLNFEKRRNDGFESEEITLLKTFASIVAISIKNTLLFDNLKEKEKKELKLIEIAKMASEAMDKRSLFGKLVSLGAELIDAESCTISILDKRTNEFVAQLPGYGVDEDLLKKFRFNIKSKSIGARVIKSGETYMTNEADKNQLVIKKFVKAFNVKRLIVTPLKTSKEILGVFYAARTGQKGPFTEDDRKIIVVFSSLAAPIIKKMQLMEELKKRETELKRVTENLKNINENLQNISYAKTNLISNISHELRTPLVSIKGYTELLTDGKFGKLNDEQNLSLYAVKRNVDRLLNTIDNLLDISKVELGIPQKIEKEMVNIIKVVEEAIEITQQKAHERNVALIKKYNVNHLIVKADRQQLLRAFLNILDNAVKFNKKGGKVYISCYQKPPDAFVEIKDTGIGISEMYHKLIFNRFFQVDSSDRRGFGGSGIGLSLSLEIVKLFGGDILLRSEQGKGSIFTVQLPLIV